MKALRVLLILSFLLSLGAYPVPVAGQSGIPSNAVVTSATLWIYAIEETNQPVSAHRITANWTEYGVTGVTWNSFVEAFDAVVIDTFTPVLGWNTVDIRPLVQGWIDGSIPNQGVLLTVDTMVENLDAIITYNSSESDDIDLRPRLEYCYAVPGGSETCSTIHRAGDESEYVYDTSVVSVHPDTNYGRYPALYNRHTVQQKKHILFGFEFPPVDTLTPGVELVKYTNGVVAGDPNGSDVPLLRPGDAVVWTYRITNTGATSIARDQITVTDNQPGVIPAFDEEFFGDGDTFFEPDEIWDYTAEGTAVNLANPPAGTITVADACTSGGSLPGRTAYVNQGTVTIPGGATDSADSSYCNTPEAVETPYLYYFPLINNGTAPLPTTEDFQVNIGFEDLPLRSSGNDYDYNDWVVEVRFSVRRLGSNPDLIDQISFEFIPRARGADYSHTFSIVLPANTFGSNGASTMRLFDSNNQVISQTNASFVASSSTAFELFASSRDIFPINKTNTLEGVPSDQPLQTASLVIDFNSPVTMPTSAISISEPHGAGLFFEPQVRVINTGDMIGRNDIRMLTVAMYQSEFDEIFYSWPEERIRIDQVYNQVVFHPGTTPPVIDFAENWWFEPNSCAYDGTICKR